MDQAEAKRKYLTELSRIYPNKNAASAEIISLSALLNLPKGTEHFMSDLHGEFEAFSHIRRNASGVIRNKVNTLFAKKMSERERAELSTLIYYPKEKLDELRESGKDTDRELMVILSRLVELCHFVGGKYTRKKVRDQLNRVAAGYDYILDELLNGDYAEKNKVHYYRNIFKTAIRIGAAEQMIIALADSIKKLVIDRLHIVGDIFDRGARADLIIDELMREESIDIQWGNHDVLWLGAASGSRTCIATVLNNSITYKNLDVIEIGYGISLRPLALFADNVYSKCNVSRFLPKGESGGDTLASDDDVRIARMHKAISIIQFKLEGQTIRRNPSFLMDDRLLLDKIDTTRGTVTIGNTEYALCDCDFPTLTADDPYRLTDEELEVMSYLKYAFMRSEKLQMHARFLYEKGEMYTICNRNLLFHGTIPLDDVGEFLAFPAAEGKSGRALMDYSDAKARQGYFAKEGSEMRQYGKDFLWFLWCGKNSPLCGRSRITTFERLLISDKAAWEEPKNAYYRSWSDEKIANKILGEFGLSGAGSHIINGHIPVNKGEDPIKAGGKLIVIDGGFCRAFISKTGIGGYTLIYNAEGMRISAHEPFAGKENAIKNNADILSDTVVFEHATDKIRVRDTDLGKNIRDKIADLMLLLEEYESGSIKETGI